MKNHNELSSDERKELEIKIDLQFIKIILNPRKQKIIDFFTKAQNYDFKYREPTDTKKIEIIDVFYYANSPLSHLRITPNYNFYNRRKVLLTPEINLDYYSFTKIDELVEKVLKTNKIDYSDLIENESFDSAMFWENKMELEIKFLIDCWKNVKEVTKSNLKGFLNASDSSGGIYDLDNGYCLWDENLEVDDYLINNGIIIEKEKFKKKRSFLGRFLK